MFSWMLSSVINSVTALSGENKLSVLTYHRVGESYNQLFMDEYLFEQQLIWIKNYFNPIGLTEALELQKKGELPRRSIVITIDDGYVDSFTTIFPLLKKHNLTATFFICTSGLEKGYLWDELISSAILTMDLGVEELVFLDKTYPLMTYNQRLACAKEITGKIKYSTMVERELLIEQLLHITGQSNLNHQFLNEQQILSLHQAGMGIGAHTVNHPILFCEENHIARAEIIESKKVLERIISAPVDFFAYPNGKKGIDFNEYHQQLVKECGFKAAFTTDWGCIDSSSSTPYALKRFTPWYLSEVMFNLRLALNFNKVFTELFN
ncbi:polysaccharide deacetylase family protein [Colwellia sp. TT2012]|uniref:polysaccharide deacetylase family protein n=1 Tax=Colwellia sp. TT2012 TaxID=1720342 RepID=UPI00070FAE5D|nr:polysaccharide deacetylase family protein [Colwellia sp. TT2012]